jgi:hypothetical protein
MGAVYFVGIKISDITARPGERNIINVKSVEESTTNIQNRAKKWQMSLYLRQK